MRETKMKSQRKHLSGAVLTGLLLSAMASTSASALDFSSGEMTGSLDTTISFGATWRATDAKEKFIGKAWFNPTTFLLDNAGQRAAPGRWSVNNDDGGLNYPDAGDLVSNTAKITSELDLRWRNFGAFTRFMAFYDLENHDKAFLSHDAKQRVGKDARLLDLYIWGNQGFGEHTLSWRVGRQVVSWGESTFIQGGINIINPVDVSRLRAAGAQLKEAFEGVNMLWGSMDLTQNTSVEALYMLEYRKIIPDPAGAFFSTNDIATPGASYVMLGFGGVPQPVINPDLYKTVCGQGNFAASDTGLPPTLVATGCSLSFPRAKSRLPSDKGQFGVALRYFADNLNSTEFALYYLNYHSRLPLISGSAITSQALGSGTYWTEYPEDIHLIGASFNSNIGTWALAGEVTYRPNAPLQIDDVEILFAGLSPLNPLIPAPVLRFKSQLGNFAPGQEIRGWRRFKSWQAQATTTKLFGPNNVLKADQVAFVAEVGFNYVPNLPSKDVLRFNGPGTDLGGGPDYLSGDFRNPMTEPDGFADDFSWGYRVLIRPEYNNVIGAWTVAPRLAWAHDVKGTTPGPGGSFIDGRKTLTVGLGFNYLQKWVLDFAYTNYMGGGRYNLLQDRDFYTASISYSF
ncbi:MAG: DUF1302 domain-containing protein [Lysobacterales bacterium]